MSANSIRTLCKKEEGQIPHASDPGYYLDFITVNPSDNGLVKRCNRTLREALEDAPMEDRQVAEKTIQRVFRWYNEERYYRALGYLRPVDYHLGNPKSL